MKRVFVCGPYSADNVLDVLGNIGRGIEESYRVFRSGFAPYCPWFDSRFAEMADIDKEDFYELSTAWLEVSDAVYLIEGWGKSEGCRKEVARASELGIPAFGSLVFMRMYFEKRDEEGV